MNSVKMDRRLFISGILGNIGLGIAASQLSIQYTKVFGLDPYIESTTEAQRKLLGTGKSLIHTPYGSFYTWFRPHDRNQAHLLPLDTLKTLLEYCRSNNTRLIFAPEFLLIDNFKVDDEIKFVSYALINDPYLDDKTNKYLESNNVPIFLGDLILSDTTPNKMPKIFTKKHLQYVMINIIGGTAAAIGVQTVASSLLLSRRKFLGAAMTTAAGLTASAVIPHFMVTRINDPILIDFRNALFALKMQRMGEIAKSKGEKLLFVVTMGNKHAGIVENLEKTAEENLAIVKEALSKERWLEPAIAPYYTKAYLGDADQMVTFQDILSNSPKVSVSLY